MDHIAFSNGMLVGVGAIFVVGLFVLWALARNGKIVKIEWYASRKRAVWTGIILFAVGYLIAHFLIFDSDFHYTTLWDFIKEGRGHIFHVAPPLAIFAYFFIYEGVSRFRNRRKK